jgi:hypothetical protein
MTPDEERASYQQSIESIQRATGTRPVGLDDSARSVSSCDVNLMKGFSRGCCNFEFAELRRAWHPESPPVTNRHSGRQVFIYIAPVVRKLHRIWSTKSVIQGSTTMSVGCKQAPQVGTRYLGREFPKLTF